MESRPFGPNKREVPVIGQGTWYTERRDFSSAAAALRRGIDLGMTHIDTAEMYGNGSAEVVIAEAISGRRDEIFLVSKVLPQNASRTGTIKACERSLARLQTDHLDCYLLHWRANSHPLEDTLAAFEQLRVEGKILSWGVSNFDVADLEEVHALVGPGRLACNQVLYHLNERAIEHRVLPWCEKHNVAVVGYSPFGHSAQFAQRHTPGSEVLRQIASAHGVSPHQVALRFLVRNPPLFTIPKASNAEHAADNAGAGKLELSSSELASIDRAFPLSKRPLGLPML
ncbi:MAG TPA: aldo/keto reductase [Candidatus Binataceae bacterium]|nr:aldo/keto reductase [Candidatus Binataceae bacterium]